MPELPEVEMAKNAVAPLVCGCKIERAEISDLTVCGHPSAELFAQTAQGKTIVSAGRRGKFIQFFLDDGCTLVIHLRMTGFLQACAADFPLEKHTRLILHFSGGAQLRFADPRRFGKVWLIGPDEKDDFTGIDRLGIEPSDPCLTGAWLKTHLGASRRAIKTCLLDQSVIAGIGNIYSDEILFAAHIHPSRPALSLSRPEWKRLAETIRSLMQFHVAHTAAPPEEYLRSRGREYRNTPFLRVYGHAGQPCSECGTLLERTVIGGRSSVFCPTCQKLRFRKR